MINPEPPDYLDNAKVIKWAWSGQESFGHVGSEDHTLRFEIYGLAICKYKKPGEIVRFCCDRHWEDIQDMDYNSVFGATDQLPGQYREAEPDWQTKKNAYRHARRQNCES